MVELMNEAFALGFSIEEIRSFLKQSVPDRKGLFMFFYLLLTLKHSCRHLIYSINRLLLRISSILIPAAFNSLIKWIHSSSTRGVTSSIRICKNG